MKRNPADVAFVAVLTAALMFFAVLGAIGIATFVTAYGWLAVGAIAAGAATFRFLFPRVWKVLNDE